MKFPILSIVIPTRNRELYCIQAIKCLLEYDFFKFEIVVQDNSDSEVLLQYVRSINDNRIVYNRIPERINSVININHAVELASGKFVTMIGDDDIILPSLFDAVRLMEKEQIDCMSPTHCDAFLWNSDFGLKEFGTYIVYPKSSKIEIVNPKKELYEFFKGGLISYQNYKLPKLYHGIVRREKLIQIKELTGHMIGGLSPDIYLAVGLSFVVEKCAICHYPLTIQGISPSSTAFAGMHGTHKGNLEDAPHLYKRGAYVWSEEIPRVYSVETIWADSAIHALNEICPTPEEFYKLFNRRYFDSVFYLNNSELRSEFSEEFHDHPFYLFEGIKYLVRKYKGKAKSLLWRIYGRKKYNNLKGWADVMAIKS